MVVHVAVSGDLNTALFPLFRGNIRAGKIAKAKIAFWAESYMFTPHFASGENPHGSGNQEYRDYRPR